MPPPWDVSNSRCGDTLADASPQLQSPDWDEGRGVYILIAGERRWRAAKLAGMTTITAMIQDRPADPAELLAIQLIENAQREDLKLIEQARAYKRLIDQYGWTTMRLGEELAIAQATVSRTLKLLELPEPIQAQVEQGALSPDSAYEISKLDRPEDQVEVAGQAIAERLSRDALRGVVKEKKARRGEPTATTRRSRVEYRLDDGTIVTISGPAISAGEGGILAALAAPPWTGLGPRIRPPRRFTGPLEIAPFACHTHEEALCLQGMFFVPACQRVCMK